MTILDEIQTSIKQHAGGAGSSVAVSYTHLTLPTKA